MIHISSYWGGLILEEFFGDEGKKLLKKNTWHFPYRYVAPENSELTCRGAKCVNYFH